MIKYKYKNAHVCMPVGEEASILYHKKFPTYTQYPQEIMIKYIQMYHKTHLWQFYMASEVAEQEAIY